MAILSPVIQSTEIVCQHSLGAAIDINFPFALDCLSCSDCMFNKLTDTALHLLLVCSSNTIVIHSIEFVEFMEARQYLSRVSTVHPLPHSSSLVNDAISHLVMRKLLKVNPSNVSDFSTHSPFYSLNVSIKAFYPAFLTNSDIVTKSRSTDYEKLCRVFGEFPFGHKFFAQSIFEHLSRVYFNNTKQHAFHDQNPICVLGNLNCGTRKMLDDTRQESLPSRAAHSPQARPSYIPPPISHLCIHTDVYASVAHPESTQT
ncbi:hypothetical protein PsorP6_012168 [Peronosclerospora sorghi]|uniref:Uncharacterized protein n=1 Tax=Peronosclerospora sorghi TaxID=230839 RepID=A0ACC0WMJ4_9STRA|nr:hypothetical protein PsorP6_012168 [Peronosclerospora sorghi]